MKCWRCGVEVEGKFCTNCGAEAVIDRERHGNTPPQTYQPAARNISQHQQAPVSQQPRYTPKHTVHIPFYKKWWFWVLIVLFIILIIPKGNTASEPVALASSPVPELGETGTEKPKTTPLESKAPAKIEEPETTTQPTTTEAPAETRDEYIASCSTISYNDLARSPEKYIGNRYSFKGQVIQVMESSWTDEVTLRINITKSGEYYTRWEDTIYATYKMPGGSDRILEDDIVTFYGECMGLETYTALLGQSISIPKIQIEYLDITPLMGEIINVSEDVNVRSEASKEGEILGKAKLGEQFRVIEEYASYEWHKIDFHGQTGYIKEDYLEIVD